MELMLVDDGGRQLHTKVAALFGAGNYIFINL